MSRNAKAILIVGGSAVALVMIAVFWVLAQTYTPFAYAYPDHGQLAVSPRNPVGQTHATVRLSIQQVTDRGPHGNWLGYQLQPPPSKQPGPANTSPSLAKYQYGAGIFQVPAHALITVIIHNYDSQTLLRNPYFSQVSGTVGGTASCAATSDAQLTSSQASFCNGSPYQVMPLDMTSHTFTIPSLGVSVPVGGIGGDGSKGYITIKFTFRTGGKGTFRWQCMVPCGAGMFGFGGPMSQLGYMNGLFHVV